jgi:O-antigen ligase
MTRFILVGLFAFMLTARTLGVDLSLAPGLSLKNLLLYAVATLIVLESVVARNRKPEMLEVVAPFAGLFLYATFTWVTVVLVLEYPYYSPKQTLISLKAQLADQLLFFLVFFYGVTSLRDTWWVLKGIVWVVALGSVVTVLDTWNMPDLGIITEREDGRVNGLLSASNDFGTLLAFFVPSIVALCLTESGWRRMAAVVGLLASLVALVLTTSRGAILGLLLGGTMAAFYLRRFFPLAILARAAVAVIFVGGAVIVALIFGSNYGEVVAERLTQGIGSGDSNELTSGRATIWMVPLRDMLQSPLVFITGFGWDAYSQTAGTRYATHNQYLFYLYNLGLIGLTLAIVPLARTLVVVRRTMPAATPDVARFLMSTACGVLGLFVVMMFNDVPDPALYIWAFIGISLRLAVISENLAVVGDQRQTRQLVQYQRLRIDTPRIGLKSRIL